VADVDLGDAATVSLDDFNLTISGFCHAYATGGFFARAGVLTLVGAGKTLRGRVPATTVSGSYTLVGNLNVVGRLRSDGGKLLNTYYLIRADNQ
jgi:hypothetical protein